MSQQHMQDSSFPGESSIYSGGYREETPLAQGYPAGVYGQKLAVGQPIDLTITAGQRLALAIVSLSFFVFIVLLFAALGFTSLASDSGRFISSGFGILTLYSVVAIFINVVFNRRR